MTQKQKEPENMMDFILSKLDTEDQATADLIKPLAATVRPSDEFLSSFRAQMMSVVTAGAGQRRAA